MKRVTVFSVHRSASSIFEPYQSQQRHIRDGPAVANGLLTLTSWTDKKMDKTESRHRRMTSRSEAERMAVFMSGGFSKDEARVACEHGAAVVYWARKYSMPLSSVEAQVA